MHLSPTLQRTIEHFAASVFACDHTMALDATRIVVPACIAAIADCVMSQVATDIPSEVSREGRKASGREGERGGGWGVGRRRGQGGREDGRDAESHGERAEGRKGERAMEEERERSELFLALGVSVTRVDKGTRGA